METTWRWRDISWPVVIVMLLHHAGAVLSVVLFPSWEALIVTFVLYVIIGLGVTVGLHRYFVHKSFEMPAILRWLFAIDAMLAAQGKLKDWVALHWKHHAHSDKPDDPHSPEHRGFLYAHVICHCVLRSQEEMQKLYDKHASHIQKDRVLVIIQKHSWLLHTMLAAGLFLSGLLYEDWRMGMSFLLGGWCLRTVLMWHFTWSVNSWCHLPVDPTSWWKSLVFGFKSKKAKDHSKDVVWLAVPTLGESLHGGHHDSPHAANHGRNGWYKIDISYYVICLMERLGLAWNVQRA